MYTPFPTEVAQQQSCISMRIVTSSELPEMDYALIVIVTIMHALIGNHA